MSVGAILYAGLTRERKIKIHYFWVGGKPLFVEFIFGSSRAG